VSRAIAFITAAASGLARGIAIDLARHGYDLAVTYRPGGTAIDDTLAAARAVAGPDGRIEAYPADHAETGQTKAAIDAAIAHFGKIDAYVHTVGPIVVKTFAKSTAQDARTMFAGNIASAIEAANAVLPAMRERGNGRLVFFGMNGSHVTQPTRAMSIYGAAKAAVVAFARTLSVEEAALGITVNVIEPGDIRDKNADRAAAAQIPASNPTGHAGSWEDIAYAVRFLISPEASFINGQTIGVNGGLLAGHE
jgi:3-oxoacyl-[acyl-carrier protein] reductase